MRASALSICRLEKIAIQSDVDCEWEVLLAHRRYISVGGVVEGAGFQGVNLSFALSPSLLLRQRRTTMLSFVFSRRDV